MNQIKTSVRWTAIIVSAIYTAMLLISGLELDSWQKQVIAALPAAGTIVIIVFDKWVWRWSPLLKLHGHPRLDGLWKVVLKPDAESHIPVGGNRGPIETYVVIEQTFWSISIAQYSKESRSYSRTSTFLRHGQSSQQTLSFLYDNTPKPELRSRSPRHLGACEFTTPKGRPARLEGIYFTDRFTQGEMVLDFVTPETNFVDFQSAKLYADAH